MVKIIVGTNRKNSVSKVIAEIYQSILLEKGAESEILELEHLPADFLATALYENTGKNPGYNAFHDRVKEGKKICLHCGGIQWFFSRYSEIFHRRDDLSEYISK